MMTKGGGHGISLEKALGSYCPCCPPYWTVEIRKTGMSREKEQGVKAAVEAPLLAKHLNTGVEET